MEQFRPCPDRVNITQLSAHSRHQYISSTTIARVAILGTDGMSTDAIRFGLRKASRQSPQA